MEETKKLVNGASGKRSGIGVTLPKWTFEALPLHAPNHEANPRLRSVQVSDVWDGIKMKIEGTMTRELTRGRVHLLRGVSGLGKTSLCRWLAADVVKDGCLLICIGGGVRVVRKIDETQHTRRCDGVEMATVAEKAEKGENGKVIVPSEQKLANIGGLQWYGNVGDGVEMATVAEKAEKGMPSEQKLKAIEAKLKAVVREWPGEQNIVVIHDIDDAYDYLTDLSGPKFMQLTPDERRLKFCLLASSSNQKRFRELIRKVGWDNVNGHTLVPYKEYEMAGLLGVDANGGTFRLLFEVLGGIPRRWYAPDEWKETTHEDCTFGGSGYEAKRKNFEESAKGHTTNFPLLNAAYTGDGEAKPKIQPGPAPGLVMGCLNLDNWKNVRDAKLGPEWKKEFEQWNVKWMGRPQASASEPVAEPATA